MALSIQLRISEVLTNRLVRLACERHLEDLSSATVRGFPFDREAAH